jgi:Cu+-exporting ATPase
LEEFSKVKYLIFDKTGTLTTGNFKVGKMSYGSDYSEEQILSILKDMSKISSHPISKSLSRLETAGKNPWYLTDLKEVKGKGIEAKVFEGGIIYLGSAAWYAAITGNSVKTEFDLFLFSKEQFIQWRLAIRAFRLEIHLSFPDCFTSA